jgi:2-keto-3-deoxy-L-rhamnonate aldolase RhmA
MSAMSGLRGRLHEPGPVFFAQMLIPEPAIASILGSAGFDFLMIDAEHGPFTLSSMRACVEALKATATSAIVRTASHSEVEIKQLLDLGVDGIMAPCVESAEEAAAVVRAARYPPEGKRGVSRAVRAARYGLDGVSYVEGANARIAVLAIIESGRGVENVEEIVAVPGIDGIQVGGDDLSADLGLFGKYDDPTLREAIDKVAICTIEAGLKIGAGYQPKSAAERDSLLVHCFLDAIGLASAASEGLDRAREAFGNIH